MIKVLIISFVFLALLVFFIRGVNFLRAMNAVENGVRYSLGLRKKSTFEFAWDLITGRTLNPTIERYADSNRVSRQKATREVVELMHKENR